MRINGYLEIICNMLDFLLSLLKVSNTYDKAYHFLIIYNKVYAINIQVVLSIIKSTITNLYFWMSTKSFNNLNMINTYLIYWSVTLNLHIT